MIIGFLMNSRFGRIIICLILCIVPFGVWMHSYISAVEAVNPSQDLEKTGSATRTLRLSSKHPASLQGESTRQLQSRLIHEAADLLNSDPMKVLLTLNFKKTEDLERINQLRQTPEYLRWRKLISEILACGEIDWKEIEPNYPDLFNRDLQSSLHIQTVRLLSDIALMESSEGDASCRALLEANKWNLLLKRTDDCFSDLLTCASSNAINSKIVDLLSQASSESLDALIEDISAESKVSRSFSIQSLINDIKSWDNILSHPELIPDVFQDKNNIKVEFDNLLSNKLLIKNLMDSTYKDVSELILDIEKSMSDKEVVNYINSYDLNQSEFFNKYFNKDGVILMKAISSGRSNVLRKSLDTEAQRQSTIAAIQIEQFRRANGRLPVNLEEAGYLNSGDGTRRAISYEVKDGKPVITTAQERRPGLAPYEITW
jgi:hypothetical protein